MGEKKIGLQSNKSKASACAEHQGLAHGNCYVNDCSLSNKLKSGWVGGMWNNGPAGGLFWALGSAGGWYGSFWGISSLVSGARRSLTAHSPCSAKREFVEPGPSRSPVRTEAAGHSHLPRPRWPTPEQGGAFGEASRERRPQQGPRAAARSEAPRRPGLCLANLPPSPKASQTGPECSWPWESSRPLIPHGRCSEGTRSCRQGPGEAPCS